MMMKSLACTGAAVFALLTSDAVRATSIDITAGPPGALSPGDLSATVLTFDDLAVGSLPLYQFSGGALSGSADIDNTSLVSKYAQPAGDTTNYLTVSYPSLGGAVQLVLQSGELLWALLGVDG